MKKHFILAAMAMTALFTACNNDDEATPLNEGTVPVTFTIGGINSRATTSATDFTTVFDNNDAIGISGTNVTPAMANVKYNVTVANSTASIAIDTEETNKEFAYDTNIAVFNAYYPYAKEFNNTFSVQTNQSAGISTSDFLTATATGSKESANVTLDFSHRLVLVQVSLTGVENVSSVSINNAKTTISYTASADGTTAPTVSTPDENTVANIAMYPQTANTTYWAIIPAQTIAAGNLIQVNTNDGKSYLYTTVQNSIFEAGNLVKYSLKIKETIEEATLVEFQPVTIKAWTNTQNEINGEIEEKKFTLTNIFPTSNPTSGSYVNQNTADPAWLYGSIQQVKIDTKETINNIENVPVISFQTPASTVSPSWSNCGLAYFGGTNTTLKPSSTYTLKFWAKVTTGSNWDSNTSKPTLNVFIYDKITRGNEASNKNMFYGISDDNTENAGQINITPTTDWEEYTFNINPSKYAVSATNNATNNSTYTSAYFSICFNTLTKSQNTGDTDDILATFNIANISFTEN